MLAFSEIYEFHGIVDTELQKLSQTNPALLFNRLNTYLMSCLSLITTPKIAVNWISNPIRSIFKDAMLTTDGATNLWDTGLIGFDVVCVTQIDENGDYIGYPEFEYEIDTGYVVFAEPPIKGLKMACDAYKDGYFKQVPDLPLDGETDLYNINQFVGIIRLAMLELWELRLTSNYLYRIPKPATTGIKLPNEANWLDKNSEHYQVIASKVISQLKAYGEQLELNGKLGG